MFSEADSSEQRKEEQIYSSNLAAVNNPRPVALQHYSVVLLLQPELNVKPTHFTTELSSRPLPLSAADILPSPQEGEDPYTMEGIPDDLNYELQMKDGIVHVYDSAEALKQQRPHSLPYPDIETFAIDLSHVLAMIADGPT